MSENANTSAPLDRRHFLKVSAAAGMLTGLGQSTTLAQKAQRNIGSSIKNKNKNYNQQYEDSYLNRVAFPIGGLGAGMFCVEGTGAISHLSVKNKPDIFNEPCMFGAISIKGSNGAARVIEGPVPEWKIFGLRDAAWGMAHYSSLGLPRFDKATFKARFPFATVSLSDSEIPLKVDVTGWSPFTPGDADSSSLPIGALEYEFNNPTQNTIEAVFSFNAKNFMRVGRDGAGRIKPLKGGFQLEGDGPEGEPWEDGVFAVCVDDPEVKVDHAWFRGGWYDPLSIVWKNIENANVVAQPPVEEGDPAPGASLFLPLTLKPGTSKTITVRLCWFSGQTDLTAAPQGMGDKEENQPTYVPWYAGQFENARQISEFWGKQYADLRRRSQQFADAFYDSTLPPEVLDAISANLTILKSPTVLRQSDGRLWAWEGSGFNAGCCAGSCTHVWNYAQAIPHLFPELERTLRETEFGPNQSENGHQQFRAALPIRPIGEHYHAAADGQLGGIMKMHRDWIISGDTAWLKSLWPKIRKSLDYCIESWDPKHKGWLEEPHHNTYDIEFWGPDGMCSSIYLGALKAAVIMGQHLQEDVSLYDDILAKGIKRVESELFNGEYFFQKIQWEGLRAKSPIGYHQGRHGDYSPEAIALLKKEGPKYQYGEGCLSDGVLGEWFALVCGVGQVLDSKKITSHLKAVYRHNLKQDLSDHANPQRPAYAMGKEGGLLLCTWPNGGALSLPFIYSNEVWTGIEYQVASHLILMGQIEEGLDIVRTCRDRYNGQIRNPFNEYECGHWYARALASYGLLQSFSGASYNAVEQILYIEPRMKGDFRSFLSTESGYGVVGVKNGKPFFDIRSGKVEIKDIKYTPA